MIEFLQTAQHDGDLDREMDPAERGLVGVKVIGGGVLQCMEQ
jgi:hypothetical protein